MPRALTLSLVPLIVLTRSSKTPKMNKNSHLKKNSAVHNGEDADQLRKTKTMTILKKLKAAVGERWRSRTKRTRAKTSW